MDPAYILWATLKLVDTDRIPDGTTTVRFQLSDQPTNDYWTPALQLICNPEMGESLPSADPCPDSALASPMIALPAIRLGSERPCHTSVGQKTSRVRATRVLGLADVPSTSRSRKSD